MAPTGNGTAHFFLKLVLVWVGLLAAGPAKAWSPGPYTLARMTVEADAILVGRATGVKTVKATKAAVISRADIRVSRWILGGPGRNIRVFFHSRATSTYIIPYRINPNERVLLFLRHRSRVRHLAPYLALRTAPPTEYALQFAKARNLGYKLAITRSGGLKGFMARSDPRKLAAALRIVRAHLPPAPTRGLSGRLWAHDRKPLCKERLHLELRLRNTHKRNLFLFTYRNMKMLYLDFHDRRGRIIGSAEVYSNFRRMRRRPAGPGDVRTLAPGKEHQIHFSVDMRQAKRPRATRSVSVRFTRTPAPRFLGRKPFWTGKLTSNRLQVRCR